MVLDNRYGAFIDPGLTVESLGSGILDGLTFAVKDVFAVAGHSSSAGNPDWLHSHHPSTEHAVAVHRLLLSGATLRGAAHTDELMYSLGGENHYFGTPINPRAVGRIPGGSSSGSAVAVASGSVDFALGTDNLWLNSSTFLLLRSIWLSTNAWSCRFSRCYSIISGF